MSDGGSEAGVGFSVDWQLPVGERTSICDPAGVDVARSVASGGALAHPMAPGRTRRTGAEGSGRSGVCPPAGWSGREVVDLTTVDVRDRGELVPSLEFVDAASRASLDRLVRLACDLLDAPVGLLAVVGRDRQFFLSARGLPDGPGWAGHTRVDDSICRYPVRSGRPLIVGDTRAHPVLAANPAVSEMGVRAYAGVPLRDPDGRAFAALCVMDVKVRDWDDYQLAILARLADIATEVRLPDQPCSLASEEA